MRHRMGCVIQSEIGCTMSDATRKFKWDSLGELMGICICRNAEDATVTCNEHEKDDGSNTSACHSKGNVPDTCK